MSGVFERFENVQDLLSLEPEEFGIELIIHLKMSESDGQNGIHHPAQILEALCERLPGQGGKYPHSARREVESRIAEAVNWLYSQTLIYPSPGQSSTSEYFSISRRGMAIENARDGVRLIGSNALISRVLMPEMREKIWPAFFRGEYDSAVFQAMKLVEINVRDKGGFSESNIGVKLMRDAFHKENGPLTDHSVHEAEREAMMALFAGAIGAYKNPYSHRNIKLDEPDIALEIIFIANHLLRIVGDSKP